MKNDSAQWIRLADVFLIGPVLIFIGMKYEMPKLAKAALIAIGIGTIFYNLIRFIKFNNL
jgi:hypothetical protein